MHLPSLTSWPVCAFRDGEDGPAPGPDMVLADKAYSSRAIREHLRKRDIRAVIPVPADRLGYRHRGGSRGGQAACLRP